MLTIYTDHIGPRHEYIIGFIFQDILGIDIRLTADDQVIQNAEAILNYSTTSILDHPYLTPHGLLSESGNPTPPRINIDEKGQFFKVDSDLIDFDLFSAAFYLLSRQEEYDAPQAAFDQHGRYRSNESLAVRHGFLNRPIIDEWAMELKAALLRRFPRLTFRRQQFSYLCTFDIDVAFAYGGRGVIRELGSRLKDLSKLDRGRMKERKAVRTGVQPDPYDTYDYQLRIIDENALDTRYFFLVGDRGPLDHNLPHGSAIMKELIERISERFEIGIHPSMGSHADKRVLKNEIGRLEKVCEKPVQSSRQHFLSFHLPETYQVLEAAGIMEDYSMGYADRAGFRASTCTPHQWYDLNGERISELRLIPLTVMDSTLKEYLQLSPQEAKTLVSDLVHVVKNVEGTFVSLWHNHSLNDLGEWEGWRSVFEHTVKTASASKEQRENS